MESVFRFVIHQNPVLICIWLFRVPQGKTWVWVLSEEIRAWTTVRPLKGRSTSLRQGFDPASRVSRGKKICLITPSAWLRTQRKTWVGLNIKITTSHCESRLRR